MLTKLMIIEEGNIIQSFGYNESGILIYNLVESKIANLEAIYKARVNSVNKKSKFAYINYLPNLQGIINLRNTNVQAGSDLLCQMVWQGDKNKLPKFSEEIKLIGKYVIILPTTTQHFFSRQLRSSQTTLSEKYKGIGIIFRSHIDCITNQKLIDNEIKLLSIQAGLLKSWPEKSAGQLTSHSYKFMQLLREAKLSPAIEVFTNTRVIFNHLTSYRDLWQLNAINLDTSLIFPPVDELPNKHAEFSLEIHKLSGINLIDINSKNAPLNFYQVNYLACEEIVRQICLRDLTGIILLDFIKNMSQEEQQKLITKLAALLEIDWRKNQMLGFTKAGICEIIRNK
ncbi:MAG: hypothetical protein K0R49_1466 [Burkholderiales bacterium]|jgi:ribonuclease G|nr:hypothetical protein [Burkholderiales bacterium]